MDKILAGFRPRPGACSGFHAKLQENLQYVWPVPKHNLVLVYGPRGRFLLASAQRGVLLEILKFSASP